jgi:hypothetical protein
MEVIDVTYRKPQRNLYYRQPDWWVPPKPIPFLPQTLGEVWICVIAVLVTLIALAIAVYSFTF